MGELGWLSLPFDESIGGFGGSFVDLALVCENFGRTLVPEPYLASVILAGMTIQLAGNPMQKEKNLVPMMEGKSSLAFAYTEEGKRFDFIRPSTRVVKEGNHYTLNGQKAFVLHAPYADQLVVTAISEEGLSLWMIDTQTPGLLIQPIKLIDGHIAGQVSFENVELSLSKIVSVIQVKKQSR